MIETMSKRKKQDRVGRPSATQPMSVFSLYCPTKTQEKFRELAAQSGYTMGEYLEKLLNEQS